MIITLHLKSFSKKQDLQNKKNRKWYELCSQYQIRTDKIARSYFTMLVLYLLLINMVTKFPTNSDFSFSIYGLSLQHHLPQNMPNSVSIST